MDKNNMATIFCPKCGKEMSALGQESDVVVH
jgi:NMD protein affecting ribosome stability and mRNA decay